MIRFALKGILGRKLRTALTAVAIVLGVAMVSGTYVLTDSIDKAFDTIFTDIYRGTDATITPQVRRSTSRTAPAPPKRRSTSRCSREVRALPEVADAIGGVASENTQLVKDGKAIVFGGAPNLGFSVDPSKPEFNSPHPRRGQLARGRRGRDRPVDCEQEGPRRSATRSACRWRGPVETLRISGLVKFGSVSSIGGATLSGFDLPTAQRLFGKEGKLDQIRASAKPGVTPQQLVSEIRTILPPGHRGPHR